MATVEQTPAKHANDKLWETPERLLPLMREVTLMAAESLGADFGGVCQPLPDGSMLRSTYTAPPSRTAADLPAQFDVPVTPTDSLAGYTMQSRQVVVIQDLTVEIRFSDVILHDLGVVSAIVVPVLLDDHLLGTVGVYCRQRREFSAAETHMLASAGPQLASLITRLTGEGQGSEMPEAAATLPVNSISVDEQRASPRHRFGYTQMIAPMLGGAAPNRDSFFHVECKDISQSGISFYLRDMPDFSRLVVRLGKQGAVSHLTARVVRAVPVEHEGQKMCLVGCRFTGRIRL